MATRTGVSTGGGRAQFRAVRAWWRLVHPPPTLIKRLEPVYYVLITLGIGGPFAYGTASTALAAVATPRAVAAWGPGLALLALWAGARWGAAQGPVVFSLPDVAHLLGAPLDRAGLALGRLLRGLAAAAVGAAVIAGLVLVGLAGHGRGIEPARAAGFVAGVAVLGVLGMAMASRVEGSARWDRATRRAGWPVFAVAVGLVALGTSGPAGRRIAVWCGPGGWAVQPAARGAGGWPVALALLLVVTVAAVALALVRRGACPTERYVVRAEARGGAIAALYSMNARYVRRSLTRVSAGPVAAERRGPRPPRAPALAILWRDAVAALAVPQRLAVALVLAAGGTVLCLLDAGRPVAVGLGALAVFAGAGRLLEPLRAETDNPHRVRVLLLRPMGRVLAAHAVFPIAVVLAGALAAVAGVAVAGALPRHGALVALMAVCAVPSIVLCAALNGRRGGRLPATVMSTMFADTSGMSGGIILAWIVVWPVLAAVLGTLPVSIAARQGGPAAAPQLVVLLAVVTSALTAGLRWSRFAP